MGLLEQFWRDETAATAIEYSLIAGLISLAIVGSFSLLAGNLEWLWSDNNSKIVQALGNK